MSRQFRGLAGQHVRSIRLDAAGADEVRANSARRFLAEVEAAAFFINSAAYRTLHRDPSCGGRARGLLMVPVSQEQADRMVASGQAKACARCA